MHSGVNIRCVRYFYKSIFSNYIATPVTTKCERFISTSKKNSDTSSALEEPKTMETVVSKRKKNWQTYGFDYVNEVDDLNKMHAAGFFGISVLICGICFVLAYYPDMNMFDWVKREGHLELHRRESLGLPLIDPNYIDRSFIYIK